VTAADNYLSKGFEVKALSPNKAAEMRLLPPAIWAESLDAVLMRRRIGGPGLWLGPWHGDRIAIGLVGSPPAIEPLITYYGTQASAIYFPYPYTLASHFATADDSPEVLLMVFGRHTLAHLARKAFPAMASRVMAPVQE